MTGRKIAKHAPKVTDITERRREAVELRPPHRHAQWVVLVAVVSYPGRARQTIRTTR
jgi:hypothetical protein